MKQLLIIGAGPYGLALAAYAKHHKMDFLLVGRPMEFWHRHMPRGMYLRSGTDWHLDPLAIYTFDVFLAEKKINPEQANPIPVAFFQEYAQWFQEKYDLQAQLALVHALRKIDGGFEAQLESGARVAAVNVVAALGFGFFKNIPGELAKKIPTGRYSHTCDTVDFDFLRGRNCLIIGGRQSAYESAALINENGGGEIHISHRHAAPKFASSDWSWTRDLVRATAQNPGWFRRLSITEQEVIRQRFWAEGRLKLEPWLGPRIAKANIHLRPNTTLVDCRELPDGRLQARLDDEAAFNIDHIILATGYRVDMSRVPYLSTGNILPGLNIIDGYPALDESFQANLAGLFFTGLPATRDFGPFFGFVVGSTVTAKIIVDRLRAAA
jgi:cation diffusion facilitator CzcD-associated flavoprotein CzcO